MQVCSGLDSMRYYDAIVTEHEVQYRPLGQINSTWTTITMYRAPRPTPHSRM